MAGIQFGRQSGQTFDGNVSSIQPSHNREISLPIASERIASRVCVGVGQSQEVIDRLNPWGVVWVAGSGAEIVFVFVVDEFCRRWVG